MTSQLTQDARELVEEHGPRPEWDHNYRLIDMVDRLRMALEESESKLSAALVERDQARYGEQDLQNQLDSAHSRLDEETKIVDRIWDLYGRPSYDDLKGRSLYDLIKESIDRAQSAEYRNVTRDGSTYTKTGGAVNTFDSSVSSEEAYQRCVVAFTVVEDNTAYAIGLNADPATDHALNSIDGCWYVVENRVPETCGALFPPGQFSVQQCTLPKGHVGEHANNVKGL